MTDTGEPADGAAPVPVGSVPDVMESGPAIDTSNEHPATPAGAVGDPAEATQTVSPAGPGEITEPGETGETEPTPAGTPRDRRRRLIEWLIVAAVAVGVALLIRTYVVQQFKVVGSSMETTLHSGDRVLVSKLSYVWGDPDRGDVVVIDPLPSGPPEDVIKRIVGLPGDTVAMTAQCVVTVNGQPVADSHKHLDPTTDDPSGCTGAFDAVTVPAGQYFVMGDNRAHSEDSRAFGTVPRDKIVGRAFVVIWNPSHWQWL